MLEIASIENLSLTDKIFSASSQFAHHSAAIIAQHLSIPYPPRASIDICLDKTKLYSYCHKHNIPYPQTHFISDRSQLLSLLPSLDEFKQYYLKSDFSKNPYYVYKFSPSSLDLDSIFWDVDRYHQSFYVLQPEFIGRHLRINILPNQAYVFDFFTEQLIDTSQYSDIISSLRLFISSLFFDDWIVKVDVIVNQNSWVLLDLGIDPPNRLRRYFSTSNFDFYLEYSRLYLQKSGSFVSNNT